MCKSTTKKKKEYIYDLLDVLNNPAKFQSDEKITFQLKLFDKAVTLKYCQGHWK